jgi:RimJ/RimL family protein N-acetyltransferase
MVVETAPLNIVLPVTLEGSVVRLEPIRHEHAELFWDVARYDLEDIFRWIPYSMKTAEDFHKLIEKAFAEQERGESVVFATVERATSRLIGSTRFMNIDRANRRVEIGSTWIAPAWQRTAVNTEAKYLMLRHAFEVWGCVRLELKTDALNEKSRNAILRIGAKEEGTLRRHVLTWTGRIRDSVYFSILDSEWPQVKANLEARIATPQRPEATGRSISLRPKNPMSS